MLVEKHITLHKLVLSLYKIDNNLMIYPVPLNWIELNLDQVDKIDIIAIKTINGILYFDLNSEKIIALTENDLLIGEE